jgi:hypothetical protein
MNAFMCARCSDTTEGRLSVEDLSPARHEPDCSWLLDQCPCGPVCEVVASTFTEDDTSYDMYVSSYQSAATSNE